MNEAKIRERLSACGIPCDEELAECLRCYFSLLLEWNERMNLTRITDEEEALDAHFVDSLMVVTVPKLIPEKGKIIDVGTGAGFPGMVLALACPGLHVTLLDSLQKRLDFLAAVKESVGAKNVALVHVRAEDGARKKELREQFDIATARAVAPLAVLAEYLLPYVHVGGAALCWKGPALTDELTAGRRAAYLIGGQTEDAISVSIPGRDWQHSLLPIRKIRPTPTAYPRRAGLPSQKPLGT
ncbi:MAG: 16S rRNA (guanine(527)-N(7))-methyltransferase RsmG [Clostridia bacterium]|nr:16S rRNA (guanine(527)-N(7))-methyltransferase RsmG [Clostridia bacterium]